MTLNYGDYGIFLIMGNAGFVSSTVVIGGKGLELIAQSVAWDLLSHPLVEERIELLVVIDLDHPLGNCEERCEGHMYIYIYMCRSSFGLSTIRAPLGFRGLRVLRVLDGSLGCYGVLGLRGSMHFHSFQELYDRRSRHVPRIRKTSMALKMHFQTIKAQTYFKGLKSHSAPKDVLTARLVVA